MIVHIYPSVLQAVSGRGYAGCLERLFPGYRGGVMQDPASELPRIPIPRTSVNKGMKKGAGMFSFGSLLPYGSIASHGARAMPPHAMSSRPAYLCRHYLGTNVQIV